MSVVGLINYLRLEGPHDLECVPTASGEDAPPPGDELTYDEGDPKKEGDGPIEMGPREQPDPEQDQSEEEPMEEEDSEEDPSEREPMEEEDPKEDPEDLEEDPSEREPMEEEDPEEDLEEDSKVNEGQLMGSKDLKGDSSEC